MAHLVTFLPCSEVIVDAFTNRVSLIGIIESVQPLGVAEVQPEQGGDGVAYQYVVGPFAVVTVWARQDEQREEFEQRALMRAPNGREVPISEISRIAMDRPYHRVLTGVPGFAFLQTGMYHLMLQCRGNDQEAWNLVHEHPLLVQEIAIVQEEERPIREDAPAGAVPE
jgi:hypothetical protein